MCWPSFVQRFCRTIGSQSQLPIGNKLTLRAQQFPELMNRSQITEERGKNTRWPLCLSCSHPQHYFPICPRSPHSIYSLLSESFIPPPFHLIAYVWRYSPNSLSRDMAMRRIFLGFCWNWFLIDPLHYLMSRSDFGFEFAEIFKIEKRLHDLASRQLSNSGRVGELLTLRLVKSESCRLPIWTNQRVGFWMFKRKLGESESRGVAIQIF